MKRMVFFCALICAVMSLSAQKLYFLEISGAKPMPNGTEFVVSAGAQSLKVNKFDFKEVFAAPTSFYLVVLVDDKVNTITLARKTACQYVVAEVIGVEPAANGKWLIKLGSGLNYTTSNQDGGTVQTGQHVLYAVIDGQTKKIVCKPRTVSREDALVSAPVASAAPAAPILLLDEENRIVGVNKRYDPNL